MQALVAAAKVGVIPPVGVVISNTIRAAGIHWAQEQGIPTQTIPHVEFLDRNRHDATMVKVLQQHDVTAIALAGYMRIVGKPLLEAYPQRIFNIHPSLLPKFGGPGMVGKSVHTAVLAANETESGCTVHIVTDEVDSGPILAQLRVPVLPNDTIETLSERVLAAEHQCYPQAIAAWWQQHRTACDPIARPVN